MNCEVRVGGVVTSTRRLGGICFAVLEDTFARIQLVLGDEVPETLKRRPAPYFVGVYGTVRERPQNDARPRETNGKLEILAHEVVATNSPLRSGGTGALRKVVIDHLHARGFTEIFALTRVLSPEADVGLDPLDEDAGRFLSCLLAPCRWYQVSQETLHFGITPGTLADLQRAVFGPSADGRAAAILRETVRWVPENLSSELQIACAHIEFGAVQDAGFWGIAHFRHKLDLQALANEPIRTALAAAQSGEAAQKTTERLLRGDVILRTLLEQRKRLGTYALAQDFPQFAIQGKHIDPMIRMFPSLGRLLETQSIEEQFNTFWSLLGHEHVKAIFASEDAIRMLERALAAGLFTDFGVLRSLTVPALTAIVRLTNDFTDPDANRIFRRVARDATGVLASSAFLFDRLKSQDIDWRRCEALAMQEVISDIAFIALGLGTSKLQGVLAWRDRVADRFSWLFSNRSFIESDCLTDLEAEKGDFPWLGDVLRRTESTRAAFDVVHMTFGNGLLDYETSMDLYVAAQDCCAHWTQAGIRFGGARWAPKHSRLQLRGFAMYPSKNRAAILAKSCSGICSARDRDLFHRTDHFQFTLVEERVPRAAGTVQLYVCADERGEPVWLLRGLNPSEKSKLLRRPVETTIEILDAVASLATFNGVSAVLMGDGAGLFNADSARLPIRTVIRGMSAHLEKIRLRVPLHIFDFHDRAITIEEGSRIWP